MTYQNDHANRQTAHGLRPLRVLVSKSAFGFAVLCGAGRGLAWLSGFANLCVFMPPVPIWQNSGGNWLKCRNGSFVILALILLPQKPRPKSHHGALNRLGKNRSGQMRAVEKAAGAEAEAGQIGLAIIRAALKSSFAENTLITSIMPR